VRRRTLGPDHPDVLNAMNSLTATLHAQGDLAGARALQQEVFELVRRSLGEKHPYAITAAWNLFMTCHSMGDVEAARAILERDLLWVLGQDPALLSVDMRGLQENLAKAAQYYSLPRTG
jgi:Tetratricopeptide repeat